MRRQPFPCPLPRRGPGRPAPCQKCQVKCWFPAWLASPAKGGEVTGKRVRGSRAREGQIGPGAKRPQKWGERPHNPRADFKAASGRLTPQTVRYSLLFGSQVWPPQPLETSVFELGLPQPLNPSSNKTRHGRVHARPALTIAVWGRVAPRMSLSKGAFYA